MLYNLFVIRKRLFDENLALSSWRIGSLIFATYLTPSGPDPSRSSACRRGTGYRLDPCALPARENALRASKLRRRPARLSTATCPRRTWTRGASAPRSRNSLLTPCASEQCLPLALRTPLLHPSAAAHSGPHPREHSLFRKTIPCHYRRRSPCGETRRLVESLALRAAARKKYPKWSEHK